MRRASAALGIGSVKRRMAGLFVGALGYIIVYVVIGKKRDRLMAEGKRLRYGSCQNADS